MSLSLLYLDAAGAHRARVCDLLMRDARFGPIVVDDRSRCLDDLWSGGDAPETPQIVLVAVDAVPQAIPAIARLMARAPLPIVAMATSGDVRAVDALAAGALAIEDRLAEDSDGAMLTQTLLDMSEVRTVKRRTGRPTSPSAPSSIIEWVVLGASTGGPPALESVLSSLPADGPPVLVCQHITDGFCAGFATWLQGRLPQVVALGEDGMKPGAGDVIIAPDRHHMTLVRARIVTHAQPADTRYRPSIDVLFRSLLEHGPRVAAALLTGMGEDGASGLLGLRQAGALTIAQDEATSVVFGMPRAAIAMGGAGEVLPLDQIGPRFASLLRRQPRA
ncbi:MAG: chemotaxis response regulator CheB [Glaciecola sp.]|jgi:chemotaxis response regulator CheB